MMDFKISPQEGPIPADSNQFVIRTRVPKSEITDEMIVIRARGANLQTGDVLLIQCFDHEYTTLLHESEYRVYERRSERKVIELSDRETKQVDAVTIKVARVRPWWTSPAGAMEEAAERELLGYDPDNLTVLDVRWNPGRKVFQVLRGEEVVAEDRDKGEALRRAQAKAA